MVIYKLSTNCCPDFHPLLAHSFKEEEANQLALATEGRYMSQVKTASLKNPKAHVKHDGHACTLHKKKPSQKRCLT